MKKKPFQRVLLKLSGETLKSNKNFGIDLEASQKVAEYLSRIHKEGIELAVVIGGGNIFRGEQLKQMGIPRTPADQMGMLATILNGLTIQESLKSLGIPVCVMSALECPKVVETYQWNRANEYLKKGNVVIFVGGTGNPFFTTDTAAALRASEIEADLLIKATKVDGIYDKDPLIHHDAKKYDRISYTQVLAEKLQVMDASAIDLCRNNKIPIFVFNMNRLYEESLETLLSDLKHGTIVE
ncbi:MAG: UMP kinase [Parachlamydiaceae bacterium]|nr:UMP kinase [Parachlamydiaceae bacterium]